MPKEKEDEKPKIKYSPGFFKGGFVFEQVAGGLYVHGETAEPIEQYPIGDLIYCPLPRCPWPLASKPIEFGDYKTLWTKINSFIHEHLFLPSEELYDVLTAWVIATWTPEMWSVVPYVFFHGPVSSGKTRGLEVLHRLSYRGILASNISGPALFRSCEEWHPTLFLDETEIYSQENKMEVIGLLNSGYRRGQYAIRAKRTEHGTELEVFNVFGFKALAGTEEHRQTLESRSIVIRMMRALTPIRLNIDEDKALEIRNRLLGWRLNQLQSEQTEPSELLNTYKDNISLSFGDSRLNELFQCLLFVVGDARPNIEKYAKEISEIRQLEEQTSIEAEVVDLLIKSDFNIESEFAYTKDITNAFNKDRSEKEKWKTASIGYILKRLGFTKLHKEQGNGWLIKRNRIEYWAKVYGLQYINKVFKCSESSESSSSFTCLDCHKAVGPLHCQWVNGQPFCSECAKKYKVKVPTGHQKEEWRCDNNPEFECRISEKRRNETCRKTGYCPISAKLEGYC